MGVAMGTPTSSIYRWSFHDKPIVLGYHHLWKPAFVWDFQASRLAMFDDTCFLRLCHHFGASNSTSQTYWSLGVISPNAATLENRIGINNSPYFLTQQGNKKNSLKVETIYCLSLIIIDHDRSLLIHYWLLLIIIITNFGWINSNKLAMVLCIETSHLEASYPPSQPSRPLPSGSWQIRPKLPGPWCPPWMFWNGQKKGQNIYKTMGKW